MTVGMAAAGSSVVLNDFLREKRYETKILVGVQRKIAPGAEGSLQELFASADPSTQSPILVMDDPRSWTRLRWDSPKRNTPDHEHAGHLVKLDDATICRYSWEKNRGC